MNCGISIFESVMEVGIIIGEETSDGETSTGNAGNGRTELETRRTREVYHRHVLFVNLMTNKPLPNNPYIPGCDNREKLLALKSRRSSHELSESRRESKLIDLQTEHRVYLRSCSRWNVY